MYGHNVLFVRLEYTAFSCNTATVQVEGQLHFVLLGTLPRFGCHFRESHHQQQTVVFAWPLCYSRISCVRLHQWHSGFTKRGQHPTSLHPSINILKHTILLLNAFLYTSHGVQLGYYIDITFFCIQVGFIIYSFNGRMVTKY